MRIDFGEVVRGRMLAIKWTHDVLPLLSGFVFAGGLWIAKFGVRIPAIAEVPIWFMIVLVPLGLGAALLLSIMDVYGGQRRIKDLLELIRENTELMQEALRKDPQLGTELSALGVLPERFQHHLRS